MPIETMHTFEIRRMSILDEKGNLDADLEPDLPKKRLLHLNRYMTLTRMLDERMLNLQRQGRLGTFAPASGQEAAHCAPALAMQDQDWLVVSFREPGAQLMRGADISRALLYYNGFEEGNEVSEGARTLPIAVIVASQLLHAVGIGYAMKTKGEDAAVVAFVGDGGTSQGDFHEALNFAGVWKAPVVFVIQNNGWAISLPRSRQTAAETLAQKAVAAGIPGMVVDGNDPLAMYRATSEALERARKGEGPTVIEAVTYRMLMHTTADDPGRYREEAEVEAWGRRDPLIRFGKYLEGRKLWSAKKQEALEAELKAEIDGAVKQMESAAQPKPDASFDHVFEKPHYTHEEQRASFLANLDKGTGKPSEKPTGKPTGKPTEEGSRG